jgi:hypothetical protein
MFVFVRLTAAYQTAFVNRQPRRYERRKALTPNDADYAGRGVIRGVPQNRGMWDQENGVVAWSILPESGVSVHVSLNWGGRVVSWHIMSLAVCYKFCDMRQVLEWARAEISFDTVEVWGSSPHGPTNKMPRPMTPKRSRRPPTPTVTHNR